MPQQNQRRQRAAQIAPAGNRVGVVVAELHHAYGQSIVKVPDGRFVQLQPLRHVQIFVDVRLGPIEVAQIVQRGGVAGMIGADNVPIQLQGLGVVGTGIVKLTQGLVHQTDVVVGTGRGGVVVPEQLLAGVEELMGGFQCLTVSRVAIMRPNVRLHFQDALFGLLGKGVVVVCFFVVVVGCVVGGRRRRRRRRC